MFGNNEINYLINEFEIEGVVKNISEFANGHINDTFLVTIENKEGTSYRIILQRMNKNVFHKPVELMENIVNVTTFLRKKIIKCGGNPDRETLNVIPARNGKPYYMDSHGEYWRCVKFIEDAVSYDAVEKPEDFYESAVAFGRFQNMLSDYPAETLYETIEGFHDTQKRFSVFVETVKQDACGRASSAKREIDFILEREELANIFADMLARKEIPLRVTHNDTKLNNIMIDQKTGKAICVIDLDTVMPGISVMDFGDAIRFGASTAPEDEVNLDKVQCDIDLFEIYVKGFLKGCDGKLTDEEIEMLPMGAKVITFEQGIRFLTDYLQGDSYFKIHRENHNLDRGRTQLKLVADMEAKWEIMNEIVRKAAYDY